MTQKTKKWLILLGVLVPAALVLTIAIPLVIQSFQPLPSISPLPNPNGYEDLVKAGEMISPDTGKFEKMNLAELKQLVATNAKGLALAQTGLSHTCRVTTQFTKTYLDTDHHFLELSAIKNLAQAMVAEGRLAELQNQPGDAAKFYLAAFYLGNESARGGILIDQLVGTAGERMGTRSLEKIASRLDAKSCRETAAALETLDAQRQTWLEVMQQEHAWALRTYHTLPDKIQRQLTAKATEKIFEKPAQNFAEQQSQTRQLMVQFAARAYELDKGKNPANLTELVPDYLKTVPQDPLTGTNLVYSPR